MPSSCLLICFYFLQEGLAFAHCTTCKAPYHIRVHGVADRKWRTLKFRFFVTRDILFIFFTVQLVLFGLYKLFFILFVSLLDFMLFCAKTSKRKYVMITYLVPLYYDTHISCSRLLLCWHIWCILLMVAKNIGSVKPGVLIASLASTTYVV